MLIVECRRVHIVWGNPDNTLLNINVDEFKCMGFLVFSIT